LKSPLRYQISEYDCGPTAMLDAVSYLFEREEIPPEIIRNIMLYSLDCYSIDGISGERGTSCTAMMFLSNWLSGFGKIGQLPVSSRYLTGKDVFLGQNSYINDALCRGGAAVVRLWLDEWHYTLLTGTCNGLVRMFDPYYQKENDLPEGIQIITDEPCRFNRIVPESVMNKNSCGTYSMGPEESREAVLLFNDRTRLTEDKTVEYMI